MKITSRWISRTLVSSAAITLLLGYHPSALADPVVNDCNLIWGNNKEQVRACIDAYRGIRSPAPALKTAPSAPQPGSRGAFVVPPAPPLPPYNLARGLRAGPPNVRPDAFRRAIQWHAIPYQHPPLPGPQPILTGTGPDGQRLGGRPGVATIPGARTQPPAPLLSPVSPEPTWTGTGPEGRVLRSTYQDDPGTSLRPTRPSPIAEAEESARPRHGNGRHYTGTGPEGQTLGGRSGVSRLIDEPIEPDPNVARLKARFHDQFGRAPEGDETLSLDQLRERRAALSRRDHVSEEVPTFESPILPLGPQYASTAPEMSEDGHYASTYEPSFSTPERHLSGLHSPPIPEEYFADSSTGDFLLPSRSSQDSLRRDEGQTTLGTSPSASYPPRDMGDQNEGMWSRPDERKGYAPVRPSGFDETDYLSSMTQYQGPDLGGEYPDQPLFLSRPPTSLPSLIPSVLPSSSLPAAPLSDGSQSLEGNSRPVSPPVTLPSSSRAAPSNESPQERLRLRMRHADSDPSALPVSLASESTPTAALLSSDQSTLSNEARKARLARFQSKQKPEDISTPRPFAASLAASSEPFSAPLTVGPRSSADDSSLILSQPGPSPTPYTRLPSEPAPWTLGDASTPHSQMQILSSPSSSPSPDIDSRPAEEVAEEPGLQAAVSEELPSSAQPYTRLTREPTSWTPREAYDPHLQLQILSSPSSSPSPNIDSHPTEEVAEGSELRATMERQAKIEQGNRLLKKWQKLQAKKREEADEQDVSQADISVAPLRSILKAPEAALGAPERPKRRIDFDRITQVREGAKYQQKGDGEDSSFGPEALPSLAMSAPSISFLNYQENRQSGSAQRKFTDEEAERRNPNQFHIARYFPEDSEINLVRVHDQPFPSDAFIHEDRVFAAAPEQLYDSEAYVETDHDGIHVHFANAGTNIRVTPRLTPDGQNVVFVDPAGQMVGIPDGTRNPEGFVNFVALQDRAIPLSNGVYSTSAGDKTIYFTQDGRILPAPPPAKLVSSLSVEAASIPNAHVLTDSLPSGELQSPSTVVLRYDSPPTVRYESPSPDATGILLDAAALHSTLSSASSGSSQEDRVQPPAHFSDSLPIGPEVSAQGERSEIKYYPYREYADPISGTTQRGTPTLHVDNHGLYVRFEDQDGRVVRDTPHGEPAIEVVPEHIPGQGGVRVYDPRDPQRLSLEGPNGAGYWPIRRSYDDGTYSLTDSDSRPVHIDLAGHGTLQEPTPPPLGPVAAPSSPVAESLESSVPLHEASEPQSPLVRPSLSFTQSSSFDTDTLKRQNLEDIRERDSLLAELHDFDSRGSSAPASSLAIGPVRSQSPEIAEHYLSGSPSAERMSPSPDLMALPPRHALVLTPALFSYSGGSFHESAEEAAETEEFLRLERQAQQASPDPTRRNTLTLEHQAQAADLVAQQDADDDEDSEVGKGDAPLIEEEDSSGDESDNEQEKRPKKKKTSLPS